jgi:hypothetical protein
VSTYDVGATALAGCGSGEGGTSMNLKTNVKAGTDPLPDGTRIAASPSSDQKKTSGFVLPDGTKIRAN